LYNLYFNSQMMKRNCTTTSNSWFLFFVTDLDSSRVSDHPLSENIDAELITTISINEDEHADQSDSPENADEDGEGFAERGVDPARTRGVDPARTRVVDPARTVVDPARTRGVDPARTRGEEE
jgi:hypothetical protein